MAAIFLFYTIQDGDGDKSTIEIPFPTSIATTNLSGLVAAVGALINPLINGGLVAAGARLEFDLSGTWGPTAALLSDVQEQAQFLFRTVGNYPKLLNLPTFIETLFTGGGADKTVDLADTDVAAFVDMMESGITVSSVAYSPSDYRGADIVSTESAVQHWGRNRR